MADWWEYPTNYSNGQKVNGTGSFFMQYPTSIIGNNMAAGIVLLIWLAGFVFGLMLGTKKALMTSSFVAFMFSIYFVRLDVINPIIPIILVILTIIGAIGTSGGSNY